MKKLSAFFLLMLAMLGMIAPAYAYVGPGPGLSMLGSFFTLLGGIALALFMLLFYPIRLLLKRRKKPLDPTDTPNNAPKE